MLIEVPNVHLLKKMSLQAGTGLRRPWVSQQSLSGEMLQALSLVFAKKGFQRIDVTIMLGGAANGELRLIWSILGMVSMAGDQACLRICWNSCQTLHGGHPLLWCLRSEENISARRVTDFYK